MGKCYEKFSPAFFDLIIFDEAHRSIFNRFNEVIEYFDARMVGLTATPASFLARDTFRVFDCRDETPTFLYTYEQAVEETQSRGAAIDVDEYVDGVRAAAAAVTGPQRQLVAVLWVAGFSRHIDGQRLDAIASAVMREAAEISARLGTSSEPVPAERT
jgi:hypothetical protein